MSKHIYQVEFKKITFTVYDDHVSIEEKGGLTRTLMLGRATGGENRFYFSDITSVQYKKPSISSYGLIEFAFAGSDKYSGGHGGSWGAKSSKQNSFSFSKKEAEVMDEAHEYIQGKLQELKKPQSAVYQNTPSNADELIKFKQLFDAGIITQEEFEAKKKQILGL